MCHVWRSVHAQRYRVYLCSRKIVLTQEAEENVLWISLWRHFHVCVENLPMISQCRGSHRTSSRHIENILPKQFTHCLIFFHVFESYSRVHLSIMSLRQCCVLMPAAFASSWMPCEINRVELMSHITMTPTIAVCARLCRYLSRRARCKGTVSPCEDVSNLSISCIWNRKQNVLSPPWHHSSDSRGFIQLFSKSSHLVAAERAVAQTDDSPSRGPAGPGLHSRRSRPSLTPSKLMCDSWERVIYYIYNILMSSQIWLLL